MDTLIQQFIFILDWFFESLISPFFTLIGMGLEWIIIKPLMVLHVPVLWQVILVAVATALLSRLLRRWMKVVQRDQLFKEKFTAQRLQQKNIDLLNDWKARDSLYRYTDNEIDEDFNTYLAQRFARHMQVYMIPLFLSQYWLSTVFPSEKLISQFGSPYLIDLSDKGWAMQGVSITVVFLLAYVFTLIGCFLADRAGLSARRPSTGSMLPVHQTE
ncbi:MAG: hypothetical protein H8E41_02000 [Desulfobulbaceae bacterium]|uniref:DUF106 domain-containing protein n=1 Tax=Candidatus Desulfobia pelagia TaxID=2841692 RepID=A0A8J6NBH3_9BACT|nr:hypothetical protein [Candidatus Desulfobia pelagia]